MCQHEHLSGSARAGLHLEVVALMELKNTTLDDLAAVIGFSAALRLSAWFGDCPPLHAPAVAEESQLLVRLIGLSAASQLSVTCGGQQIAVPQITQYENDVMKHRISRLHQMGFFSSKIVHDREISARRVQQILAELREANLLTEPAARYPQKSSRVDAISEAQRFMPATFFAAANH